MGGRRGAAYHLAAPFSSFTPGNISNVLCFPRIPRFNENLKNKNFKTHYTSGSQTFSLTPTAEQHSLSLNRRANIRALFFFGDSSVMSHIHSTFAVIMPPSADSVLQSKNHWI